MKMYEDQLDADKVRIVKQDAGFRITRYKYE